MLEHGSVAFDARVIWQCGNVSLEVLTERSEVFVDAFWCMRGGLVRESGVCALATKCV